MNKIAIFGATGNTGLCALDAALKAGLKVRVLVRSLEKVPDDVKDKIEVVVGDVLNINDVSTVLQGTDAVCVVLGTRNDLKPTTVLSQGMINIIKSMKEHSITKVSVCLSAFLFYDLDKVPKIFMDINADHHRQYNALKDSGFQYVAVFPPHIADEASGKHTIEHGKSPGRSISKWDLGTFLIASLSLPEHYGKVCGIATVK